MRTFRLLHRHALSGFGVALTLGLAGQHSSAHTLPCTEEAIQRGLVYQMMWPLTYGYSGFGCGFADLNNDGHPDVIILGNAAKTAGFFENDGTGNFVDRSATSGIPQLLQASGFAVADYDGDGLADIYFTQNSIANVLMRNVGNFQFQNVTAAAGVGDTGTGQGAHWGDFDGDGWLDLYVCNYTSQPPFYSTRPNVLYRNKGDGTFEDVSVQQTVNHTGLSFQAVWFDMDRDGDLDLYVSNDRGGQPGMQPNQLWRNDNGQMVNISVGSGANLGLFSMGLACGDFTQNGYPDLYVTNIAGYAQGFNPLLVNQGNSTFVEASAPYGVDHWKTSWGCIFFDFTNDGTLDLYVNNQFLPNSLYLADQGFPAVEVGEQANVLGTNGPTNSGFQSYSSAVADVNGDGTLDILINNFNGNVQLFMNHDGASRRWIRYNVKGMYPNFNAIGANVDTRIGTKWQFLEVYGAGNGYKGQNELTLHVGAGDALNVDEVVVNWPGGKFSRTLSGLPTNQVWTIYPPAMLGDHNGDGVVNLADFLIFVGCCHQPVQAGLEMMDFNGDSFIDLIDFEYFLDRYEGDLHDCDHNGVVDLLQIVIDPKLDKDQDGQLNSCDNSCPADIAPIGGNGIVNVDDLVALLGSWGPCGLCDADIAPIPSDGLVNVDDLVALLGSWGSCK